MTNHGAPGSTLKQLYRGQDGVNKPWREEMASSPANVVIVNHGLNDGGMSAREYRRLIKRFIDAAHRNGKVFILESPNDADPHKDFNMGEFRMRLKVLRETANETGVYFCEQPRVPLLDAIHPTPEGYLIKAERLAECIGKVERKLRPPI